MRYTDRQVLDVDALFDEAEPELTLAPPDRDTDLARLSIRETAQAAPVPHSGNERPEPTHPVDPPFQFSIGHLLIGNLLLAAGLAVLRLVAPQLVAGGLGIAAFLFLVAVQVWQPADKRIYVASGILILAYVVVATVTLLTSDT